VNDEQNRRLKKDVKIALSSCIAFTSASAISADIGDFRTLEMEISLLHFVDSGCCLGYD
jgi:hypothetical protein